MSTKEFLYNAIQDTVSTIRAIDTKLHIVLGLYLLPLAMSDKLCKAIVKWSSTQKWDDLCTVQIFAIIFASISFFLWLVGMIISIRGIIAISNPAQAIEGQKPNGTFYYVGKLKGLFQIKLDSTLDAYKNRLPSNDNEIVDELAFEQMKLSYIRDIKIARHKKAAYCAIAWGLC